METKQTKTHHRRKKPNPAIHTGMVIGMNGVESSANAIVAERYTRQLEVLFPETGCGFESRQLH